jgi:thiol:disulfide interchange protein
MDPNRVALVSFCITGLLSAQTPAPVAPPVPANKPAEAKVYDETADARAQIAAALAKAKRDNQRVLIQWGANWCGWCKLLHKLAAEDPAVRKELLYEYEVVHVDVGRFDKHLDLAEKYGADLKKSGLPYLTVLAADGSVVANQETGSLEKAAKDDKPGHDPAKVMAFLTKHQATAPKASDVMTAALARAKTEDKRVFLHFGAPWCGWCHRLEDWMAKPEVAAILAKEFVDTKVDTERMAGGQALLDEQSKGKSGGIPWFEFLAPDGAVLATSTAQGGNIGFPAKPEEIAWFVGMLKASPRHLTAEDIAALERSLQPAPAAAAR